MSKEIYVPARREIKDYKHSYELPSDEYIKIEELEKFLRECREGGATHLYTLGDNFSVEIDAYHLREENDEEYESRVNSQKQSEKLVEKVKFQEAREVYFKLKDKFE